MNAKVLLLAAVEFAYCHHSLFACLKEISLSSDQYFRCIFVAKAIAADESDGKIPM